MWHCSEMAARWQEPNPSTCPGLCPKSARAGRRTEQGAVLEVRASSAAAVISAGRGIFTNEPLCSQQRAGNIFPHRISRWLMHQCHPPQCHRVSRKLPDLSLHPKPPHPQELGAVPVFHPFSSNPSPHPSPWKSPAGCQAGITARYKHTQPGCPNASSASHTGSAALLIPKQPPVPTAWVGMQL